jgi:hypothetical protein
MGKLLALSLMSTLAAAVLFQPLLMGKPRDEELETGNVGGDKSGNGRPGDRTPDPAKPRTVKPVLATPRVAKPIAKPRSARPRKITPDSRA